MALPSPTIDDEEHACLRGVHQWGVVRHVLTSEPEAIECRLCGYKIDFTDDEAVTEQIRRFYQLIQDLKVDAEGLLSLASAFNENPEAHEKLMVRCKDRITDVQNLFESLKLLNRISDKM